jgi:2-dehydro-3-deoxyphosphogluconate aldolase/(4S)-4-hydroxy-2-oxoglutarate aldolase
MGRDDHLRQIDEGGVIAIVRFDRSEELVQVARAVRAGGVRVIEFTMTTPNALQIIEQVCVGSAGVCSARTS